VRVRVARAVVDAHRRVGGRRGGNAASGGGRPPHPPRTGVRRVARGARLFGREKNGKGAWHAAHGRSAHGHGSHRLTECKDAALPQSKFQTRASKRTNASFFKYG